MHDPSTYTSPHTFTPERFLSPHPEPDPVPTVFGWGRRICPGLHLAEASLWIYAASLLATMTIRPVKDEKGAEVLPKEEFTPGII